MGKTRTLRKRRTFSSKPRVSRKKRRDESFDITLRDNVGITAFSPTEKLKDINLIGSAIMECLIENDPQGAMEAIKTHLEAMNKTAFLKEAGIPRSTMYKSLKTKNPTLKTLAKIMYVAHHSQGSS
jgi:DNA-binding phage protein